MSDMQTRPATFSMRGGFAGRVTGALGQRFENAPQLREIDRLAALSDAELAAMGLRRGGIAGTVLASHFGY